VLTEDEVTAAARSLWRKHADELPELERVRGYERGILGRPTLPDDADDEIKDLSKLAVKNIMPLVVDSFVHALSVTGCRSPSADANTAAWSIWQRERMDARQAEVHRPAVVYGASYLLLDLVGGKVRFNPRSPRRMFAAYADPTRDEWPQLALETWIEELGGKKVRRGLLWDAEASYEVLVRGSSRTSTVEAVPDAMTPHKFGVVPVVRFVNERDTEEMLRGEVGPLIHDQKAINAVNFDRLIVSRFGAFPQKYLMGWAADSADEARVLSARRMLTFDDPDVKAGAFPSADVTAYNAILDEMVAHVAIRARVPVFALTGDISNVGADTIALVNAPNQRKVASKQESFGESWEQALRLAGKVEGVDVPEDAEVLWHDTEARSFAQVVDGVVKLTTAGVPIELLVDQIPGITQQKADALVDGIRREQATGLAAQVIAAARTTPATEPAPVGA
jgi:hypothetical protein